MNEIVNTLGSFTDESEQEVCQLAKDALELLKEQEERLRKLQKDKDKLCLEISEWKHKFHDTPPKFVSQGVVDQIRWERDTALSQLEQIGKGLGSKMDDIVAMLKEQEAVVPLTIDDAVSEIIDKHYKRLKEQEAVEPFRCKFIEPMYIYGEHAKSLSDARNIWNKRFCADGVRKD